MRHRRVTSFDAGRIGARLAFVRFVVPDVDSSSRQRTGVVQAAYRLERRGLLTALVRHRLGLELDWLSANLPVPTRFVRTSSKGFYRRESVGVSWYKAEAIEHIAHAEAIARIVADSGMTVQVLRTGQPGYVVYQDAHQVVAIPFRDDRLEPAVGIEPTTC